MHRLLALCLLLACSRRISGPAPAVLGARSQQDGSASPAALCNAQRRAQGDGWLLDVLGQNFAPLPANLLADSPGVVMPQVTLAGPESYVVPESRVRFADPTRLVLEMPTRDSAADAHQLPAGDYSVSVANLGGAWAAVPAAIRVVEPPQVSLLQVAVPGGAPGAPRICDGSDQNLIVTGTGFRAEAPPRVALVNGPGDPVPLATPAVSPNQLVVPVPAGTFDAQPNLSGASYTLNVTDPAGCSAPSGNTPRAFSLTDVKVYTTCKRLGTVTVVPAFGWAQRNQPITIHASGAANFTGGAPAVAIIARLKGGSAFATVPLRSVGYLDANTLTAVVPTCSGAGSLPTSDLSTGGCPNGIAPGDPYTIDVQDPQGAFGGAQFTVLAAEAPTIASISPQAIDTAGTADLTIASAGLSGSSFPAGARAQIVFPSGGGVVRACDLPLISATASAIHAKVQGIGAGSCVEFDATGAQLPPPAAGGFTPAPGLFVIRVKDATTGVYGDFSGLLITSPSAAPASLGLASGSLNTARGSFALAQAADDTGARFLYALGGITAAISATSPSPVLSSVEVGAIDRFGDVPSFQPGAGLLTTKRRGLAAFSLQVPGDTGYVFVAGGVDSNHAPLDTVERAQVLRTADAPVLDARADVGGALAAGSYYYRVSALLPATDPSNPGGETLPSDLQPATVPSGGRVILSWPCVPNATGYRVYRTSLANQPATSFRQIGADLAATVSCAGSPLPRESWTDAVSAPLGQAPRPRGALGAWVQMPALSNARGDMAARLVGNRVYIVGGCDGSCDATGSERQDYETAQLVGISLGSFSSGPIIAARRRTTLAVASKATAPDRFADASSAWLVVAGGEAATPLTNANRFEVAHVLVAGNTVASPVFAAATYALPSLTTALSGGWAEVAGDFLFAYGSTGPTAFALETHDVCSGSCASAGSFTGTFTPATAPANRYLPGETIWNGIIYAAGGLTTADATGTAQSSVERIVY